MSRPAYALVAPRAAAPWLTAPGDGGSSVLLARGTDEEAQLL